MVETKFQRKTSVGAFEAKTHFSELLDRVEKGEQILITRHGRTVAILTPHQVTPVTERMALIQSAVASSKGTSLPKGKTIGDLINEGRKR
jgi:prevent-host-death family protein